MTALSSLGSSTLHITANSLCGGSSNTLGAELGMSHWLNDGPSNSGENLFLFYGFFYDFSYSFFIWPSFYHLHILTVKTEIKSPPSAVESSALPIAPSHLDSALFCTNTVNLDATQSSNAYDHKQEYYNYYNR